MRDSDVRSLDITRIEADLYDHESRLRSIKEEFSALENHWAVTKMLAGVLGFTGVAIIGFLVYVNDKASSASQDVADHVAGAKSQLTSYIDEKKVDLLPTGTIVPFGAPFYAADGSDNFPSGWLPCDGRALSSAGSDGRYTRLFAKIGASWGNGTAGKMADAPKTDFNVPDLRGQFLRGVAYDSRLDPDSAQRTDLAGKVVGGVVGSYQADQVGPHTHALDQKPHTHKFDILDGDNGEVGAADGNNRDDGDAYVSPTMIDIEVVPTKTSETRPKNVYVNYLIKL